MYNNYSNVSLSDFKQVEDLNDNVKKVPHFDFETIEGKKKSIKDLKGKIVLLNFWATWCPPCIKEIPAMLELAATDNRVVLLAISNDIELEKMQQFLKKQNQDFLKHPDVYMVFDKKKTITQSLFQTYKLPETIIIDEKGLMRKKIIGYIDWEAITIDQLLAQ